ncbi:NADP-dependent isocitrate dehydrogenase [Aureibacter tunicatorum]|uniref:Isocitrate dehydrogenase [NADP] n=1 Tax=Aureibacter tunicatorum TaxID=866807 RepID=A0AAE3XKQ8_9BACT|nr:NADP-dependent isocitrate dehydrogenase [Aureibacter tunicatorum]MDR6237720.1 isocitrate dehydrogenase [Aureibacter tunicatorum]BDD02755.1 isocitrate dehydrogenase [Aureibacter tunicatorum]
MVNKKITVAYGDGIGPEIMKATLDIIKAAGARIETDIIEIGKEVYLKGISAGIEPQSWDSLKETKVFLKAPITTPQGGGFKSLNVTTRKTLGLYANVRPCRALSPYVHTHHPKTDIVIVRENEEDLYAGIEHQQTDEVVQCIKLISRPGCERIVRYAFEYAKAYGRKKVTCMTKDNIMKQADGLFHQVFNEIGEEYPEIEKDHIIIDIGSAIVADKPETLDVVVTLNLYGDIISDIAAQITGSVGLGGSSNIGQNYAMFEAIHGSAPDIAGKNIANPSGLLNGAIMMLVHIGQPDIATIVHNAWLRTIEDGIHTGDIYKEGLSTQKVGTKEFAEAVIKRLGEKPIEIPAVEYTQQETEAENENVNIESAKPKEKALVGVDVFLNWNEGNRNPNVLGELLEKLEIENLSLKVITSRGVKVYPHGNPETFKADHWICRFYANEDIAKPSDIIKLLDTLNQNGLEFVKTEHLYTFDGERGFSLAQGE